MINHLLAKVFQRTTGIEPENTLYLLAAEKEPQNQFQEITETQSLKITSHTNLPDTIQLRILLKETEKILTTTTNKHLQNPELTQAINTLETHIALMEMNQ